MTDHYTPNDLIDYVEKDPHDHNYSEEFRRGDSVEALLPDGARVAYEQSGGYQGTYALVVEVSGFIWVEVGSYGSCSGCDSYMAHKAEETERILRDAYCFKHPEDVARWAFQSDDWLMVGSGLGRVRDAMDSLGLDFEEP